MVTLETRLRQAQAESMAPLDLISWLVTDELTRRADRILERRRKHAKFGDPLKTLDNFDFTFNKKMNRSLVFELATSANDNGGLLTICSVFISASVRLFLWPRTDLPRLR